MNPVHPIELVAQASGGAVPARPSRSGRPDRHASAFSLIEVMVTVAIAAVALVAVYAATTTNLGLVRRCQENERATQLLTERFEALRLYTWNQIHSNGYVRTNFVVPIDPAHTNAGRSFTGSVFITQLGLSESYSNELLQVTVQLDWASGDRLCSRSMSSLVTRYGLQNYLR